MNIAEVINSFFRIESESTVQSDLIEQADRLFNELKNTDINGSISEFQSNFIDIPYTPHIQALIVRLIVSKNSNVEMPENWYLELGKRLNGSTHNQFMFGNWEIDQVEVVVEEMLQSISAKSESALLSVLTHFPQDYLYDETGDTPSDLMLFSNLSLPPENLTDVVSKYASSFIKASADKANKSFDGMGRLACLHEAVPGIITSDLIDTLLDYPEIFDKDDSIAGTEVARELPAALIKQANSGQLQKLFRRHSTLMAGGLLGKSDNNISDVINRVGIDLLVSELERRIQRPQFSLPSYEHYVAPALVRLAGATEKGSVEREKFMTIFRTWCQRVVGSGELSADPDSGDIFLSLSVNFQLCRDSIELREVRQLIGLPFMEEQLTAHTENYFKYLSAYIDVNDLTQLLDKTAATKDEQATTTLSSYLASLSNDEYVTLDACREQLFCIDQTYLTDSGAHSLNEFLLSRADELIDSFDAKLPVVADHSDTCLSPDAFLGQAYRRF